VGLMSPQWIESSRQSLYAAECYCYFMLKQKRHTNRRPHTGLTVLLFALAEALPCTSLPHLSPNP